MTTVSSPERVSRVLVRAIGNWRNERMATHNIDHEIRSRIDSFLGELSLLVKQQALEAVQDALGEATTVRRGPGRPRGSGRRGPGRPRIVAKPSRKPRRIATRFAKGKRVRRSAEDLAKIGARVLAQVRSKAGQRLEEIGRALKTDTAILKKPVADLLKAKKLKTKGAKRGTRYFVR